MPNWALTAEPRWCRWSGLAGSLALAAGGLRSGALPRGPGASLDGPPYLGGAVALTWFGVGLLTAAWLLLGRSVASGRTPSVGWLCTTLTCWAAPLLLAPPLFSRDVYSYLAQGALLDAGLDVYTHGPADLGGPEADQVPEVWRHTPAPYGPLFLLMARAAHGWAGSDPVVGLIALRVTALVGTLALVALLPRLARACRVAPQTALWLGALNPLLLLHLIAGAHNEALLLPLLLGGLLAARRSPVLGAVLVTLAALVKVPAVLALPAVWWLGHGRTGRRGGLLAGADDAFAVLVAVVATTVLVTAVSGTGFGWLDALGTPASAGSWSPVTAVGRLVARGFAEPDRVVTVARWAGSAVAAAVCAVLAHRVRTGRLGAVHATGLALAAVVALGPAVRPWYALWAVPLLAAAAGGAARIRWWTAGACAVLAFSVFPDGWTPGGRALGLAAAGVVTALLVAAGAVLRPDRTVVEVEQAVGMPLVRAAGRAAR
ncbi:polyprenol phosphomannose-dependent alpha 1,6 mannosyltransferase MptB [Kitasatospora sp. NPDC048365]|uniref:polyprenol phosphomannose-dependent alpha 1,6 mannosyltransferase MptB n=1 Tax=Kitasatospora sp. NPDC048365 TaxID=3364050 RepID=UPI003721CF01